MNTTMHNVRNLLQSILLITLGVIVGRWSVETSAAAQIAPRDNQQLTIGEVDVALGASKAAVLNTLRRRYYVLDTGNPIGEAEFWRVMTNRIDQKSLGNLKFQGGRLIDAARTWDEFDVDRAGVSFFKNMCGAFESASRTLPTEKVKCTVSRDPDSTSTSMHFFYGNRSISLNLGEVRLTSGRPYNFIAIHESIAEN